MSSNARKEAFEEIHTKIWNMRRVMTPDMPHMFAIGYCEGCDDIAKWLYRQILAMDEPAANKPNTLDDDVIWEGSE